jgi:hypothetical protein
MHQLTDRVAACLVQEAEASEKSQPPMVGTCRAIVKEVVGLGVEEQDRKRTWMADAGGWGAPGTACLRSDGTTAQLDKCLNACWAVLCVRLPMPEVLHTGGAPVPKTDPSVGQWRKPLPRRASLPASLFSTRTQAAAPT